MIAPHDMTALRSLRDLANRPPVVTSDPLVGALDRLSRVAPPPWTIERHGDGLTLYSGRDDRRHGLNMVSFNEWDWNKDNLIRFIENAPTDIQALLHEVAVLRAENASLREALHMPPRRR